MVDLRFIAVTAKVYLGEWSKGLVPRPTRVERTYLPLSLTPSPSRYEDGPGDYLESLKRGGSANIFENLASPNFDTVNLPVFGSISTSL
jgi:hypothetical protein